jgi:hypothetical protein
MGFRDKVVPNTTTHDRRLSTVQSSRVYFGCRQQLGSDGIDECLTQ